MSKNNTKNVASTGAVVESKKKTVKAPPAVIAVAPPAAPEKKTTKEQRAEFISKAQNVGAFITKGAAKDVLGGRVGARTHAMHAVLLDAAMTGALLKTSEIEALASQFMLANEYASSECKAGASHMNTMSERKLAIRENGAWRLSDEALKLCGAKWAQDVETEKAPAKKKKAKK